MIRHSLSLLIAGAFCACGGDAQRSTATVRDSAGIVIVENAGPGQWTGDEAPSLEMDLVIGEVEGDPDYTFGRIADVAVDSRGRFLVLDEIAQHVKVFDSGGTFLRTIGRAGEGPGELGSALLALLVSPSDTLYVPDEFQKRVNVYGPGGEFNRMIHPPSEHIALGWAIADGGELLYRGMTITTDESQRWRTWDGLLVMRNVDRSVDTLMTFDYETPDIGTVTQMRLPLIRNTVFWDRLDDGRIAWSALDQDRVFIHAADATLERVVTHGDWRLRPASSADRAVLADLYRERRQMAPGAPLPPSIVLPDTMPAITGLRAGPAGTFWVQRMGDAASVNPDVLATGVRTDWLGGHDWDVFDAEGRLLGGVRLPDGIRITRITERAVVGVQRDELDVERVVRLRLN